MMHVLDPLISPFAFLRVAMLYVQIQYVAWRLVRVEDMTDKRIVLWSFRLRILRERLRVTFRRLRRGR